MQFDTHHLMGCSPSSDESEYEEYVVPWNEQWRHARCTVRARHQLIILDKPGYCDFCRIVKEVRKKTPYRCEECRLNFCFNPKRNHFRKWHSPKYDGLRSYA